MSASPGYLDWVRERLGRPEVSASERANLKSILREAQWEADAKAKRDKAERAAAIAAHPTVTGMRAERMELVEKLIAGCVSYSEPRLLANTARRILEIDHQLGALEAPE